MAQNFPPQYIDEINISKYRGILIIRGIRVSELNSLIKFGLLLVITQCPYKEEFILQFYLVNLKFTEEGVEAVHLLTFLRKQGRG